MNLKGAGKLNRKALALTTVLCATTYVVGLIAPPAIIQIISPRPAPAPPAADSEEGRLMTERIEKELMGLELLKKHRAREGISHSILID